MFEHPYTQTPCYRKLLQCEFQAVKTVLFQICNIIIGFAFLIGCFIFYCVLYGKYYALMDVFIILSIEKRTYLLLRLWHFYQKCCFYRHFGMNNPTLFHVGVNTHRHTHIYIYIHTHTHTHKNVFLLFILYILILTNFYDDIRRNVYMSLIQSNRLTVH